MNIDGVAIIDVPENGFAWGYGGSGPSQLALAILLHAGFKPAVATKHYMRFKEEFLARAPKDAVLRLVVDVRAWVQQREQAA